MNCFNLITSSPHHLITPICSWRLHPFLASMAGFLLEQTIELSHDPRLGGARVARRSDGARQDGRMDEPHCAVVTM